MDATMYYKNGGNYMMRSAKRPGLTSGGGGKPPRRHIVYKIVTILMLILCFPIGLIMLWLKHPIRWPGFAKLLISVCALVVSLALFATLLSVDFSNPTLASIQQQTNQLISRTKNALTHKDEPELPDAQPSEEPSGAPNASADPAQTQNRPMPTVSETPFASVSLTPSPDPDATESATPTPTITPTPTPTPTATPEPTIDPALIPPLRSAGEITVYFSNNGKWYHATPDCGSVSDLPVRTLSEAASAKKPPCPYCKPNTPISTDVLAIENAVYVTDDHYWHVNFGCESAQGLWTVVALDEVLGDPTLQPCDACGAIYYADGLPALSSSTDTATDKTAASVVDSISAISNGSAIVYVSERSAYYHAASTCPKAPGVELKPLHLEDALLKDKTACPDCSPVEPLLNNAD